MNSKKTLGSKSKYFSSYKSKYFSSYSTAKNMPKIAEVKLSNCGLEVVDFRKSCNCGIPEFRLWNKISLKSYGIAIADVLPSSCRIAIVDSKKVACAHLCFLTYPLSG
jgi:hypothetical protein